MSIPPLVIPAGGEPSNARPAPPAEEWQVFAAQVAAHNHNPGPDRPILPLHVMRSSQLDATRLDDELASMLRAQLHTIFHYLAPAAGSTWEHELNAILYLWVYGLTLWKQDSTPGALLTNLRFLSTAPPRPCSTPSPTPTITVSKQDVNFLAGQPLSPAQKVLLGFGYIFIPMLHNNLQSTLSRIQSARGTITARATSVLHLFTKMYKTASLINLFLFFSYGKYRTLWERLLGIRMVYNQPTMNRLISFEYLNRQLVWHELSEFLLYFLPLVDFRKLSAAIKKLLPQPSLGNSGTQPTAPGSHSVATPTCPICTSTNIIHPFVGLPCSHVFCYYCVRAHCEADATFACPIDGIRITAMRQHRPEPLPPEQS